jgi:hypothetical protein
LTARGGGALLLDMTAPRRRCRYDAPGSWLKGQVHLHSTASDGGLTPAELGARYGAAGYDFLALTDHWVAADPAALPAGPPLWLPGVELDGRDDTGAELHVVCLGAVTGLDPAAGLLAGLRRARAAGALTILAHPQWSGNATADALRHDLDGVEVYNHVCHWLNGKSDGGAHWNARLERHPDTFAFAVDDAHLTAAHPGWNGGWIVARAAARTPAAIVAALRAGCFYSSQGPRFLTIACDDTAVHVTTSPVQFVRLVGPAWRGARVGSFSGELRAEATLPLPADWPYAYVEIEDAAGRRAWTNPLLAAG